MRHRLLILSALVLVFAGCALRLRSSNQLPDDAWISLRYADHLAHGEGLRFNPGGERVEGFSSPLHVLLLACGIALGLSPELLLQLLPLLAGAALVGLFAWVALVRLGPGWGAAAALALGLNPALSTWARGGLETTLFSFLVLLALVLTAGRRERAGGYAAGLVMLTRPEGVLHAAALAAVAAGGGLRRGARLLGIAAAVFAPWWIFRLLYFGAPLPNTWYAKMDGVRTAQMARGLDYLAGWVGRSEVTVPLVLALLGLLLALVPAAGRGLPGRWTAAAWSCILATAVFAVLAGGDHMMLHRFLVPALAPLHLLAGGTLRSVAGLGPRRAAWAAATLLALALLSQPVRILSHDLRHPAYRLDRPLALVEPRDDSHINRFYRLGEVLGATLPENATVAVVPAGALPWAGRLRVLDMLGLNDPGIAHQAAPSLGTGLMGHEKGTADAVLARDPDFILLRHGSTPVARAPAPPDSSDLALPVVRSLWESTAFHARYEAMVVPVGDGRAFTLYRRRAAPR
jgi:hypothetical protein